MSFMSRHNPYKLFDYYTEEEADLFFGREAEVSSVVGDILDNKLLVLFARSGSGKTSLLNAGVGPELRKAGCINDDDSAIRMVNIRLAANLTPQQSALQALHAELPAIFPSHAVASDTLFSALKRHCTIPLPSASTPQPMGLVLVFDQFEEMFISVFKDRPEVRRKFAQDLAEIVYDETLRVYVVLSLRSEYFHHLNEFRAFLPSIFQNNTNLELRPFNDETALRVIRGPADRQESDFKWAEGLPERIVADLRAMNEEGDGVLPIHLQIVCYELYERLGSNEREITFDHYMSVLDHEPENAGQSAAAVMVRQRIIGPLEAFKGCSCRHLYRTLRELITRQQTKAVRRLSDLRKAVSQKHLGPILSYLEQKLLLRSERSDKDPWYELRHDYLARAILPWLEKQEGALHAKERRLRYVLFGGLILLTYVWFTIYHNGITYTAHVGLEGHTNELVIVRHPMFWDYTPSCWKKEIATGIFRSGLQAGGDPNFQFPVSSALSDWKDIEPHLRSDELWRLQIGTRLPEQIRSGASNNLPSFDIINHPEIQLYAAAEQRVRAHILNALSKGTAEERQAAVWALGAFAQSADTNMAMSVIADLRELLKHSDPEVKCAAARAVAAFARFADTNTATIVIADLRHALTNSDSKVTVSAVSALGAFAKSADTNTAEAVIADLRKLLKESSPKAESPTSSSVAQVLERRTAGRLGPDLRIVTANGLAAFAPYAGTNTAVAVAEDLRDLLNASDANVKGAAARALALFAKLLNSDRAQKVFTDLVTLQNDSDDSVMRSAQRAVTTFAKSVDTNTAAIVTTNLCHALTNTDSHVKISTATVLGYLAGSVDYGTAAVVITNLLILTNDPDSDVRVAVANTLASFAGSMDIERAPAVFSNLIELQTNRVDYVRRSAQNAVETFAKSAGTNTAQVVVTNLRKLLNTAAPAVKSVAAYDLATFASFMDTNTTASVTKDLRHALTNSDSSVTLSAISALRAFAASVDTNTAATIVADLRKLLNVPDQRVKRSALFAVIPFAKAVDTKTAADIVEALYTLLQVPASDGDESTGYVLAAFGSSVDTNTAIRDVTNICNLLKDTELRRQKGSVAYALAGFAKLVDTNTASSVLADLRALLKDPDHSVKRATAYAMTAFAKSADTKTATTVVRDLCDIALATELEEPLYTTFAWTENNPDQMRRLAEAAARLDPETAGLVLSILEAAERRSLRNLSISDIRRGSYIRKQFQEARRILADGKWEQGDRELLSWLGSNDSRRRAFACIILAHRKPFATDTLTQVQKMRDKGSPWARMTALQCLVEVEREKQVGKDEARENDLWDTF